MWRAHVYEMFRGRKVASFDGSTRARDAARAYVREHAASVPDEAGMIIAAGKAEPPDAIDDADDLIAAGFTLVEES